MSLQMCLIACQHLCKSSQSKGRNERWWWCEEWAAAASFTALLVPLESQCLSLSFQEKCGVCGRVGSAINAGCQKENAGVYTMPLNHWVKVFLLHSSPPRTFFFLFPRRTKHQRAACQGCTECTIRDRCRTFWSNKEDSFFFSLTDW